MVLFNRNATDEYENIDTDSYKADYFAPKADHVLVDVRSAEEYAEGHIPSAINIPLQLLPQRVNEIPNGKPVIVVCATGNRSRSGASNICQAGYEKVYNLTGGTMRWMMSGSPIDR